MHKTSGLSICTNSKKFANLLTKPRALRWTTLIAENSFFDIDNFCYEVEKVYRFESKGVCGKNKNNSMPDILKLSNTHTLLFGKVT